MRKGTVSQTVLYLACKNGGKTPEEVLENTWHSFSTGSGPANVCAWNPTTGNYDRPLYYYFTTDGLTNVYCYQLLRDGDGQCHAWADLLSACWKANGIGSAIVLLAAETNSYRPAPFLVRNVALKVKRPQSNITGVYRYYEDDFDLSPEGIPGPKAKKFNIHFVLQPDLSTNYYDPSYGLKAQDMKEYTPIAIGAWSIWYTEALWAPQEDDPQRVLQSMVYERR